QFDQFHPAWEVLKKMTADNAKFRCFPDSVHTNGPGGLLMAHSILTAMRAPALVSDAALDADGKVQSTKNCDVRDLKSECRGLTYKRLVQALPLAVSPDGKGRLSCLDNLSALNVYGLKVTGLKDGRSQLSIDGKKVGELDSKQLAGGVNLALYDLGPIT